ncbi:MAG: 5'-nucleotidase C-terminal domain-containing protein [Anaerolineae bacterium]
MVRRVLLCLALLAVVIFATSAVIAQDDETFALTIIHTNDEHAQHDPNSSGDGGIARQAAVIAQIRAAVDNAILVDGGDRFTGSLYHQQYRGQDNAQLMNMLGYQAMTPGNHEFDDGPDTLAAFIDALNFPVVSANITVAEGNPLEGKMVPYAVLDVNGQQIGVIGLTTAETPLLSSPGEGVTFSDAYAQDVQAVADELTAQGINKIVLLTHLGYGVDVDLASQISGVDVIVGGHSHTLLGNAYTAAEYPYPAKATSASGEPVVIVQAGGGNTLYLGRLDTVFDSAGVLTSWNGDTIFMSRFITPDPEVESLLTELAAPIEELKATAVGESAVFLVGDRAVCRVQECNLGDLITDAMRAETGAQIAITNGGGIRSNVPVGEPTPEDTALATPQTVTLGDVLTVLPFGNLVSTFELSGADVVAALENGVSQVENGAGRFPQVSGIRYTWDPAAAAGGRIVSVEVLGEDGSYTAIDPATTYTLVSNDFMRRGGDGYSMFADSAINPYDFGRPLDQVLADYIAANSPINPQIEGRITAAGQ